MVCRYSLATGVFWGETEDPVRVLRVLVAGHGRDCDARESDCQGQSRDCQRAEQTKGESQEQELCEGSGASSTTRLTLSC